MNHDFNGFSEFELAKYLTDEQTRLHDYIVIHDPNNDARSLFVIRDHQVWFTVINDQSLYHACLDYLVERQINVYDSLAACQKARPELTIPL